MDRLMTYLLGNGAVGAGTDVVEVVVVSAVGSVVPSVLWM